MTKKIIIATWMFLLFFISLVNTLYALGNHNIYITEIVICLVLTFACFWTYLETNLISK